MAGQNSKIQLLTGVSVAAVTMSLAFGASAESGLSYALGTLNASMSVGYEYNTNQFAEELNEDDDFAIVLAPKISWTSDWASGNNITLTAESELARLDSNTSDDTDDYAFGGSGIFNINDHTELNYGANYQQATESRGSAVDFGTLEPVEYNETRGFADINQSGGIFELSFGGSVTETDYEDGKRIDPNTLLVVDVNNDDRDRLVSEVHGKISYAIAKLSALYVSASFNVRDFDDLEDLTGIDRDSDGYSVGGGIMRQLSDISTVSVGIHYHKQDYDDSRLSDTDGVGAEATFVWLPSELTTVAASVGHQYDDTSLAQVSGALTQSAAISVDHLLTDKLTATLDTSFSRSDYEGVGVGANAVEREDDTFTAGLTFNYHLSDHVGMTAGASYIDRDSNVQGDDFENTKLSIRATISL